MSEGTVIGVIGTKLRIWIELIAKFNLEQKSLCKEELNKKRETIYIWIFAKMADLTKPVLQVASTR